MRMFTPLLDVLCLYSSPSLFLVFFFRLHAFVSFCPFLLIPLFSTFLFVRLPSSPPSFFALLYYKTVYGYITRNKPSQKSSACVYFISATFPSGLLCSLRAIKQSHKQTYRHCGLNIIRHINSCFTEVLGSLVLLCDAADELTVVM